MATIEGHPYIESNNHASKGIEKDMKLGGGGRFASLTHELQGIGRKKYGAKKMASMAAAGR